MRIHLLILILSSFCTLNGQDLRFENYEYLPHIKSVKFHLGNLVTSEPIIDLDSRGSLRLSFDDILGGDRTYTYKIIHCDKDWQPSDISEMDYMDGFNDEKIEDYEYSVGTKYDYTNYRLTLPNQDLSWRISGNYLLVITDDDSGELALTRRFMVAERSVSVGIEVLRSRRPRRLLYDQEIDIKIDNQRYPISNPQKDLFVTILQNGRWDNAHANIQPKFSIGDVINFDQTNRPYFPGYNEFRGVDIRTINTRGYGVFSIDIYEDDIDVLLDMDFKRSNTLIQSYDDLNGDFIIGNLDYSNQQSLRAEYVNTYFSIVSDQQIIDGDVYVVGAFTNWRPIEEFRMSYDLEKKVYHGGSLLKQGYYDYQYLVLKDDGRSDIQFFEGSHYAASNQYHVLVYHRSIGDRYDKLIGVSSFVSEY